MTIRVRFAPSPTGELHVGGARTAVFNWLFARKNNGKFLLRIEDTDRERSSDDLTERIIEGMRWLGLDWDEDPLFQSKQIEMHLENAEKLLSKSSAYRCFCDSEKLKKEREDALKAGAKSWKYPRYCRDLTDYEVEKRISNGDAYSVRFKIPEGRTLYNDLVHGKMNFDNSVIDDFIILRTNGTPTYQLSVVSDDIVMGITHVIRGDDHISNTPKQILIYNALEANTPEFVHIPLILGPDKKRLSKRHGATSLLEYSARGYLSEAMLNFLALLGWSPGDNREYLSKENLVEAFSFKGINRSGAVFDEQKLEWLNGQYLTNTSAEKLIPLIEPYFRKDELWSDEFTGEKSEWFHSLIDLLKTRCRRLPDFVRDARPYILDDFDYDEKGVKKHLKGDDLCERLTGLKKAYDNLDKFDESTSEAALRKLADEMEMGGGKLIHPLRMALVGVPVSPGVFEVAEFIGKEKTVKRLERLIKWIEAGKNEEQ